MNTPRCCSASARAPWGAVAAVLASLAVPAEAQVPPPNRPEGVTDSAITWGEALFRGPANCSRCHGDHGRGSGYGPDLADAIWWHGPGTFEWLVREVTHGIPENLTVTGGRMPARGWAPMNDADVRAVAAYVWSISHPPKPPPPESPGRN
jgi:mono/diheme cytochrome c family protein